MYKDFFNGSLDISDLVKSIKYKREFRKLHPTYFDPDGILVFCGSQGSGKTLSAVQYCQKLAFAYPNMILVTNINLDRSKFNNIRIYEYTDLHDLNRYSNGYDGVCFLIDEIQIEFNSLESKMIDPVVITEISQQRKQRKHIVGTSQVFNRIAKPFREQFKMICMCKCFFGLIQFNKLVNGEDCIVDEAGQVTCSHVRRKFWFHSPTLYKLYDTYAKVIRTNEVDFYGHPQVVERKKLKNG